MSTNITQKIDERLQEYRKFAFKDDMLKLAIAFILGGAFAKTVTAISECLIMPVLNYVLKFTGDNWREATWEPIKGIVLEVGKFAAVSVDFLLISIVLFYMWRVARGIQEGKSIHIWRRIFPWKIQFVRREND